MTYDEVLLPGIGQIPFYARLYHNHVKPCVRESFVHVHPALEISYFPDCDGVCAMNDGSFSFSAGDLVLFRSNEQHFFTELYCDHMISTTGLHFFPELFWSNSEITFDRKYSRVFSNHNTAFRNRLDPDEESTAEIKKLFLDIEQEFAKKQDNYGFMVRLKLLNILLLIIRSYDSDSFEELSGESNITDENIQSIQSAVKYIDEHITENITLSQLSEIAAMSTSYFSRLFKELNGFSTWDYIISKRVGMAQKLLINTDMPVYEIAYQCGFNNTANFNKAFRKISSISPREYRTKE